MEPGVWLAASGLSVGILMVAFLLGFIGFRGIEVFWPKPVVEMRLAPEDAGTVSEPTVLAGVVAGRETNIKQGFKEWRIFTGNKDVFGNLYRYVDAERIQSLERPPGLMRLDRLQSGDAIGYPVELVVEERRIKAEDPGFRTALEASVEEVKARLEQIDKLEKQRIPRLSEQIANLEKRKESRLEDDKSQYLEQLEIRLALLQAELDSQLSRSRDLRVLQNRDQLRYRVPGSGERVIPIGEVLDIQFPNQMNLPDRILRFFGEIEQFIKESPRQANTEGGIYPALIGTVVMTLLMSVLVMPFGVVAAIYLHEYASQGPLTSIIRIAVNNLAGVPSIVYGVFGLGFFVYLVGGTIDQLLFSEDLPTATFGTGGILWASLTLALMTLPVVIVATEEALAAVPAGVREASMACGATKWQTLSRIILPAASPGMLTGLILAMARGAGEVAPLMFVGVIKLTPSLPVDGEFPFLHLERKFMHLGFHIYDLGFQSPDSEAARPMVFATTLLLIVLVVVLNLGAILIRHRLLKKYAESTL